MVKVGLLVIMEAKPGKEQEVESFLEGGLALVNDEPGTTTWFALKMDGNRYGIFDAFGDESGRDAHLNGQVAAALMAQAEDLFSVAPTITKVDVLAAKLPA